MSWWNTLDTAGRLSKFAYTALKTAQSRIDEALDIAETDQESSPHPVGTINFPAHSGESCKTPTPATQTEDQEKSRSPTGLNKATPVLGSEEEYRNSLLVASSIRSVISLSQKVHTSSSLSSDRTITPDALRPNSAVTEAPAENRSSETDRNLLRHKSEPNDPAPASSALNTGRVSNFTPLPLPPIGQSSKSSAVQKASSEGDLPSALQSPASPALTPNFQLLSTEDDFCTNTTGSDIEVISCSNSTNGGSLQMAPAAGTKNSRNIISNPTFNVARTQAFPEPVQISKFYPNVPHSAADDLRHSSTSFAREHRRAVSASQSCFGFGSPGEEDLAYAFQRLSKKMAEKKYLLTVREEKILQLCKDNSELRDLNAMLEEQLKTLQTAQDVTGISTEFSNRLAATEKRVQLISRERDQLKRSLATAQSKLNALSSQIGDQPGGPVSGDSNKSGLSKRITELERTLSEKNEQIDGLLKEGEKLAQDQLKTNALLKKMRSAEKESAQKERSQNEKIEQLTGQLEQVRSLLNEKETTLRDAAGKLDQLCKLNQDQETEIQSLKVQLNHYTSMSKEHKSEITDLNRKLAEAQERLSEAEKITESHSRLTEHEKTARYEHDVLKQQLDTARNELAVSKSYNQQQGDRWREEVNYYQGLLAETQARLESMKEAATTAAQPALHQLESLQLSLSTQTALWEQKERDLNQQILDAQRSVTNATEAEKDWRDRLQASEARIDTLEALVSRLQNENAESLRQLNSVREEHQSQSNVYQKLSSKLDSMTSDLTERDDRIRNLQELLTHERAKVESKADEIEQLTDQVQKLQRRLDSRPVSATPSEQLIPEVVGRLTGAVQTEGSLESRRSSVALSRSPSTLRSVDLSADANIQTAVEYLQSLLHLKDGECAQLRREVERLAGAQETLLTEVARLTSKTQRLARLAGEEITTTGATSASTSFSSIITSPDDGLDELQRRYETLLVLYGKVTEENNELKMDLADVKDMYKAQIDMLLRDK
ncbi:unnamed protein product [Calicophoron daubneyi]|uniref:TATA element modulatory factor 1 TATA binding domain-containing protein n=1 Tax=Calicophoron daubneyi TaxID=300641 RepID=A0AAV2TT69_CALDB